MIARMWHGVATADKSDAFFEYIKETGLPGLKGTPGNQGVWVLRHLEDGRAHFLMISLWESREAITAFAGSDLEKARYYSRDKDFLLELEPTVTHYEVLAHP